MQILCERIMAVERLGIIETSDGLHITANGPPQTFPGEICDILDSENQSILQAEILSFHHGKTKLMAFGDATIHQGYRLRATGNRLTIPVGLQMQGRVLDAFGNPLDNKAPLSATIRIPLENKKINPLAREPVTEPLRTGIHALDGLLPLGKGQRIGIFAGSGVGKSVLIGMLVKEIPGNIHVIALIGERGRELHDFLQNLDEERLNKSILVVACSDESALIRRQAVYTAIAIAEFFCEQGKDVVLFMDSITRFAHAQREIGLHLNEPPTARGYTPSVFARLPSIVERAGNFKNKGSITAIYTVLVDGDDFNEPIADCMRSLLDGHIILTRTLAQRGHYPAIDILQSVSRLISQLFGAEQQKLAQSIVRILSIFAQNKDLIELGAIKPGDNPALDANIARAEKIHELFRQDRQVAGLEREALFECFRAIVDWRC